MMRNAAVVAVLVVGLGACGAQSAGDGGGQGGAAGSGGAAAAGGGSGSGGASGSGGVFGTGGSSARGGDLGTGGGPGTGGVPGRGGTIGTGGALGTGGATGSGGVTPTSGTIGSGGRTGAGGASGRGGATGGNTGSGGAGGSTSQSDGGSARDATPSETARDVLADTAVISDSAPQTCTGGKPAPTAGDATVTLQYGGRSRKYILHTPSGLAAGTALAVVFDLHGAGGSGSQQKGMSGFSSLADKEKFLAVFPDGIDGYWNVDDTCCGTAG